MSGNDPGCGESCCGVLLLLFIAWALSPAVPILGPVATIVVLIWVFSPEKRRRR